MPAKNHLHAIGQGRGMTTYEMIGQTPENMPMSFAPENDGARPSVECDRHVAHGPEDYERSNQQNLSAYHPSHQGAHFRLGPPELLRGLVVSHHPLFVNKEIGQKYDDVPSDDRENQTFDIHKHRSCPASYIEMAALKRAAELMMEKLMCKVMCTNIRSSWRQGLSCRRRSRRSRPGYVAREGVHRAGGRDRLRSSGEIKKC